MKKTQLLACLVAALSLTTLGLGRARANADSVSVNGATIHYVVTGHGPAMMLVHGYPLSGKLFSKVSPILSRRYTVVCPDLRGFGASTTPDSDASVSVYAKDMLGVMDHLKINKAIIGGMSMGGPCHRRDVPRSAQPLPRHDLDRHDHVPRRSAGDDGVGRFR